MRTIKIFIVDDHSIFRDALKIFFSYKSQYQIIGEASNGQEFLSSLENQIPDVVLMDIHMPEMDGAKATKFIDQSFGGSIKVIALTMHEESNYLTQMIKAGVSAYVHKSDVSQHLEEAINTVMSNKYFFREATKG